MPHLHYLIPGSYEALEPLRTSAMASVRLRLVPGAQALQEAGWHCSFGDQIPATPSKIVVTKIGATDIEIRQPLWLQQLDLGRRQGASIWLDYTDHHLGFASAMSDFYRVALPYAHAVIVPSRHMASLLADHWSGPVHIIEDAIEVASCPPKPESNVPVNVLWFGHASNVAYLRSFLETGLEAGQTFRLIALSNAQGLNSLRESPIQSLAKIEILLGIWSPQTMLAAAAQADLCIIPSDIHDPRKAAAGSNRLITALALGLPTAADALPSYTEFQDYFTALRSKNFQDLLNDPLRFQAQVLAAQQRVVPGFAAKVLGEHWVQLLG